MARRVREERIRGTFHCADICAVQVVQDTSFAVLVGLHNVTELVTIISNIVCLVGLWQQYMADSRFNPPRIQDQE
jgi:hypothetical protein